ncbi:ferritin-like protein [Sphingomonas sp. AR_OL41]|uniref:ferritin-like domain-containing protein n=1 Tax=Sphingomonas sp. AR_OL41 TaxID=3042729 RepID=UPI0024818618|nr:ferritin-like protein [Sphingomonas sp. AR_OL41]MDH7974693.1 ferritin-like protein [Sphingomonas sp. AR_OL41]
MIRLLWSEPNSTADVQALVQGAIDIEFSTLPPYLYASLTILPDTNAPAKTRLQSVIMQEMIHMCLASNIMNAIGGTVAINPPSYPGPLPGDVGGTLTVHLYPFSEAAMAQGMAIESPLQPIDPRVLLAAAEDASVTIGEYYERLKLALKALPPSAWTPNRNQIDDAQYFQGQVFAVNDYDDARRAIDQIVSEGEGTPKTPENQGTPLDFQHELAHYYRFWEIEKNQVLEKDISADANDSGYMWGAPLGVDWCAVYPAIPDPELYDFATESEAVQRAQASCNAAYTAMVDGLSAAFSGGTGDLGVAVRAMFDLRMAAITALNTPLKDGSVAGPAFLYEQIIAAPASAKGDAA